MPQLEKDFELWLHWEFRPHLNEAERLESNLFFNRPLRDFITWLSQSETNDLDFWESFLFQTCILQCLPQMILNLCLSIGLTGPRFAAGPRVLTLDSAVHCCYSAFSSVLPCFALPSVPFLFSVCPSPCQCSASLPVPLPCSVACFRKSPMGGSPSEMYILFQRRYLIVFVKQKGKGPESIWIYRSHHNWSIHRMVQAN